RPRPRTPTPTPPPMRDHCNALRRFMGAILSAGPGPPHRSTTVIRCTPRGLRASGGSPGGRAGNSVLGEIPAEVGGADRLGPVGGPELRHRPREVHAHRLLRDVELGADLP